MQIDYKHQPNLKFALRCTSQSWSNTRCNCTAATAAEHCLNVGQTLTESCTKAWKVHAVHEALEKSVPIKNQLKNEEQTKRSSQPMISPLRAGPSRQLSLTRKWGRCCIQGWLNA
eukprot:1154246-Pelagomonas_calceolata.AAC.2